MHSLWKPTFAVVASGLVSFGFACSDTPSDPATVGTGGHSSLGSGGSAASGGHFGTGGATGTGGLHGTGGTTGTGGAPGKGGAPGTGGKALSGSGGKSSAQDAGTAAGGRTAGGGQPGSDGKSGSGGAVGSGGTKGVDGGAGTGATIKKFFGNIDTRGAIRSDFKTMWDQFTPENAGKWGSVQGGGQSSFSWSTLDTMYKYTQDNNIIFKEHCFCWGQQQPGWVNNSNGTTALKAWMKAFCERYPKVAVIDVFNESLHNSPAYKEGIGGTGTTGYDWLVNAFKWAREACPNAILLYNDYNTIEYSNENNGVIKLVSAIKAAGAPIDGVGCQAHDVAMVSAATVKNYVQNIITRTGVPVYITEIDVGVADDAKQTQILKDVVTALWDNENVKGFTYWGYVSGTTWRANTGLMSSSGTKRPALTWLMGFLGR